jgi:hypothetical protein
MQEKRRSHPKSKTLGFPAFVVNLLGAIKMRNLNESQRKSQVFPGLLEAFERIQNF